MKQLITSHYNAKLYYGSEVWFNCMSSAEKTKICSMHYFPLRLLISYFKRKCNRKQIDIVTKRAPFMLNNYKITKLLISVCSYTLPQQGQSRKMSLKKMYLVGNLRLVQRCWKKL